MNPNSKAREGDAWDAYVWVTNVDGLTDEFRSHGARILRDPYETDYHIREVLVEDLDGYRICFGQDHLEPGFEMALPGGEKTVVAEVDSA